MDKETLADQIQSVLKECPHVRRYKLSVMELSNSVVIGGTVSCFYHKQMAQEAIRIFLKPLVDKGLMLTLRNEITVDSIRSRVNDE
jgi:hypothetical protein